MGSRRQLTGDARAAVVYKPVTVSEPQRARRRRARAAGGAGQTPELQLRDLAAPSPGSSGLYRRSRSPSLPSRLVPHSRLTVRREAGERSEGGTVPQTPGAPPSLRGPQADGAASAHALAGVAASPAGEGRGPVGGPEQHGNCSRAFGPKLRALSKSFSFLVLRSWPYPVWRYLREQALPLVLRTSKKTHPL